MVNNNGYRSRVQALNVMKGDELMMRGEENVIAEEVLHYSTKYRNPSHVVIVFRKSTGEPVSRTYGPKDYVSVVETPTSHTARRRNSRAKNDVLARYIRRDKGVFPVEEVGVNPSARNTLKVLG
jgi:hypothetical protein